MSNSLVALVNTQRERFLSVAVDRTVEFEREAQFALQALNANDYLARIALDNTASLQNAIINVSAIGISLNPASKLAYLVPRDSKVCLDISYMGMMHLAQQCGAIQWGQSAIVREKDEFALNGVDEEPTHKYNPFSNERGEIVGVYVVVKTDGGDYLTHAMPISAVYDIRNRSAAWKAWEKNKKTCPWVTDLEEMIKKTCVKQAAKYWPRRDRLDQAVHHLNTDGGEGIILGDRTTLTGDEVTAIIKTITDTTTKEAATTAWQEAVAKCKAVKDMVAYESIKTATTEHMRFIDSVVIKEVVA